MSYWNYRVVRHEERGETYYAIHEVHYDDADKPTSMSKEPTTFQGESLLELGNALARALASTHKPVFEPPEHWKS